MDSVLFGLDNNKYIVEINKSLKLFSYTEYDKYEVHIIFYDLLRNPIFDILTNEKILLNFFGILSDINNFNFVAHFSNIIFNSEVFCIISNYNDYRDYPTEEETMILLQFFRDNINGKVNKINVDINIDSLDTLIFNIWQIIDDIPYLESIELDMLNEYMHEGEVYV